MIASCQAYLPLGHQDAGRAWWGDVASVMLLEDMPRAEQACIIEGKIWMVMAKFKGRKSRGGEALAISSRKEQKMAMLPIGQPSRTAKFWTAMLGSSLQERLQPKWHPGPCD